jgi:signal transduction histidine kinase
MQSVTRITALINEAVVRTRQLAQGLYPVELKEAGLQAMLRQLADQLKSIYGVDCEVIYDENFVAGNTSLAINLFRIAQEAANNAIKHGAATKISISTSLTSDTCLFEITDNGSGIDNTKHGGLGMHTMRYRATLIGATFSCEPMSSGGTKVTVKFPA